MSGDGLEDIWIYDYRGDLAYKEGRLVGWELREYLEYQDLKEKAICCVCGEAAPYEYLPKEEGLLPKDRWKCFNHAPLEALPSKDWNGEWWEHQKIVDIAYRSQKEVDKCGGMEEED